MRRFILVMLAVGCSSEGGLKPIDEDPTSDPSDPSTPQTNTTTPTTPTTTPTGTTTTPTTTTPTGTGTPTYPTVEEVPPAPPLACPHLADAVAVADCAAGGYAALYGGTGYFDVQPAIDASAPGDTIVVCPGSWTGGLQLQGGRTLTAADPAPGVTTLDGDGAMRVVTAENATLIGLTLTDGASDFGSGVYDTGSLLLECVYVTGNTTTSTFAGTGDGGGVWASNATVRYSSFSGNWTSNIGGALVAGTAVIEDSVFSGNYADYGGGALSVEALELRRSVLSSNEAGYEAGAVDGGGKAGPGMLLVEDCVFELNRAGYEGGAIEIGAWDTDPTDILRSRFTENTAPYGGTAIGMGTWGGIDLTVSESTFRDNSGGDALIAASGWVQGGGTITLEYSLFEDNTGASVSGFLSTDAADTVAIAVVGTDLVVHRNTGTMGALYLRGGDTLDCTNCDFGAGADDNTPQDGQKGGSSYATLPLTFFL